MLVKFCHTKSVINNNSVNNISKFVEKNDGVSLNGTPHIINIKTLLKSINPNGNASLIDIGDDLIDTTKNNRQIDRKMIENKAKMMTNKCGIKGPVISDKKQHKNQFGHRAMLMSIAHEQMMIDDAIADDYDSNTCKNMSNLQSIARA